MVSQDSKFSESAYIIAPHNYKTELFPFHPNANT